MLALIVVLALSHGALAGDRQIVLNNFKVDSSAAAGARSVEGYAGKRLTLLQFDGKIKPEWVKSLQASGLRIVASVPENAYLVYGPSDALAAFGKGRAAANAPWAGRFLPKYKYHKAYLDIKDAAASEWVAVQLVADADANASTLELLRQLSGKAVAVAENQALGLLNARALVPLGSLAQLAAREDVLWIAPHRVPRLHCERQGQTVANNITANASAPTGPGYLAWLTEKGFTQQQFLDSSAVVVVVDDGFDNGNANSPANSEFRVGNLVANASRVSFAEIASGTSGFTPAGVAGHGNINISIVGGYNNGEGANPNADSSGYHYGLGINPFARLASTKVFDDTGWANPDEAAMVNSQYARNCRVSSNSWGASASGEYTSESQDYDTWTRDAQPAVTGNQEFLFVFSAGNDGSDAKTIGSPATAKNVIAVGASENYDPGYTDGCAIGTSGANNANDIIDFSSRGPCADGRAKPDIVAPGTHIHGAASQSASYDGSSVCDKYNPAGQTKYAESSGTSHSCPGVAGGASLVRQYFTNRSWSAPSPAMTKAYLLNSARYLNGVASGDNLWSNNQGMGCMNLGMAFDSVSRSLRDQLAADKFTATGQSRTYNYFVSDSSKPLRVTLAWTDAPGSVVAPAYNNNLNLAVTAGGNTYLGNRFSGAFSTTGGSADAKNNVESVFLPAGVSGAITVTVTAFNLTSDGIPGNGSPVDQDFALVAYNASTATHTVTFVEGANGTITGTKVQTVGEGADCSAVTAVPNANYHFSNWTGGVTSIANPLVVTNVTKDMTITANFAAGANIRTVTFAAGTGGTITGTKVQTVEVGANCSEVTAVPAEGYHFANWTGDYKGADNPLTIKNVTSDMTITANFSAGTHTVTFVAGAHGTVTGTKIQTVETGANCSEVAAVPAAGYHFVNWTGDYKGADNPLTIKNVTRDMTITANFAIDTHTVTFVAGANGSISGAKVQTVNHGADCSSVTAVPATGHHFVNWTGDYNGTVNPLTLRNITADMTVTANFAINVHTVTFIAGANGSLTGTTVQTVNHGADCSEVTAVPDENYHFAKWTGSHAGAENPLTITNVTGDMTVTANFALDTHTVTFIAGANGSISGAKDQTVNHGAGCSTVTAVPATGYRFVNWTGDYKGAENPLTITNVTANMAITANFALGTQTVTFLAGNNGSLTGTTVQAVNYGADCSEVTAVPATNHHFANWTGGYNGTDNPLTLKNVTADMTVTANFALDTHTVTFVASPDGSIVGDTEQTVSHGADCSPDTAVADKGHHFVGWTGGYNGADNPLTLKNVTADMTVTANFATDTHTVIFAASAGGSIAGDTEQTVDYGADCSPDTAVADEGHHFVGWTGDYSGTDNPLTLKNVTADMTVTANFALDTHTVTFVAGANGSLVGTTVQTVNHGADCSEVAAKPDANYHFVNWTGGFSGVDNPLTVKQVTRDMTVTANFALDTHTVTFVAGTGGAISGTATQVVNHGADCSAVGAVHAVNYHFVNWTGDRNDTDNPLTVKQVTKDMTVKANFALDTHTVTFVAGANGSLSGATAQTVNHGADCSNVTAIPGGGYRFDSWTGSYSGKENPLTVKGVTTNMTVTANFVLDTQTVTFVAGANGSIVGDTEQTVNHGADCSKVTAVPDANHHFVNWTGDYGGVENPLTIKNVTKDMSVTANFGVGNAYKVVFAAKGGGSLSGDLEQAVLEGADCLPVVAVPDSGHYFDRWADSLDRLDVLDTTLTVKNVSSNMTVTANFVDQEPYHVAPGSVFTYQAATPLVKKPNVAFNGAGGSKAKVLNSGKEFKGGVTSLRCNWANAKERASTGSLFVNGESVTRYFTIEQPSLVSVSTDTAVSGGKITVTGLFFGSAKPAKLYLSYTDAKTGKERKANCKLDMPSHADASGKDGKSYMDVNSGASELTFTVPENITAAMEATLHIEFKFAEPLTYDLNRK